MVPGRPDCEGYQRRQARAGHIQDDIPDAGCPGGEKPLAPLVHRGIEQAKPQRPEARAAQPVFPMSAKSPEPEKVHEAVCQDVTGFPQIEIGQINLGRFQSHKPGQQPLE